MKPIFITIALSAVFSAAKAQKPDIIIDAPIPGTPGSPADSNKVFTSVEQIPMPQGGIEGFYKYLAQNIRYPEGARKKNVQGTVRLKFIVEKDGSITDIKVVKAVSDDIDAEAVRVISASPKWTPGIQDGKPVRVQYMVPISFSLQTK